MLISDNVQRLRERGDTIVEVLIAIAVISLVLAGAYATTNRSLLATRSAQERATALKLAESQVEQLKSLAKTDPDELFTNPVTSGPFCISSMAAVDASDAACQPDVYNLSIERSSNTFTVVNEWEDVSGDIIDELRIIYRVYQ